MNEEIEDRLDAMDASIRALEVLVLSHIVATSTETNGLGHETAIVLAAPSAIQLVRCSHLQDVDTGGLHISQKPRAIAAGAFNANPLQVTELAHPCQH